MNLNPRYFADKLNRCLDDTDVPVQIRERTNVLSKMLDISKQLAYALLEGHQLPDQDLLNKITSEFELDLQWWYSQK